MAIKRKAQVVYTTGEAAQLCKVSQQTIIRCFDDGALQGFRVPRSKIRRIPRESLIAFMQKEGIPTDALEIGQQKVLIAVNEPRFVKQLASALDGNGRFSVRSANNGFDACALIGGYNPDLIVLDAALPDFSGKGTCGKEICHRVRNNSSSSATVIVCIGSNLRKGKITELREAGANDFMPKPVDVNTLTDRICRLLGVKTA